MTKLAGFMQLIAKGGYRVHKQWGLMTDAPRPPLPVPETPANSTGIGGDCGRCGVEDVRLYSYTTKDETQTVDVCVKCLKTLRASPPDAPTIDEQADLVAEGHAMRVSPHGPAGGRNAER